MSRSSWTFFMILLCQIIFFDSFRLSNTSLCKGSNYIVYAANAYIKTKKLSLEGIEFLTLLTLIYRLPSNDKKTRRLFSSCLFVYLSLYTFRISQKSMHCIYASSACAISAIRSSLSSRPQDILIRPADIPASFNCSSVI